MLKDILQIHEFWIGKDAVVVKTTNEHHRELAQVWPEIGCINLRRLAPETGEINDKWIVSRCQDYIEEILKRDDSTNKVPRTEIAAKYPDFTCH